MSPFTLVKRMATRAWSKASVSTIIRDSGSQCTRIEVEVNINFKKLNVVWHYVDHNQNSFFLVNHVSDLF